MKALLALLLLALPAVALAQERVFDLHVHIWKGEQSVREYEAQLARDGQTVTRFGGIHMAVRGKLAETRAKNDELFALARRYPKLLPIPSVHPYDGQAALDELSRLGTLGARIIKLHAGTQGFDPADARVKAVCERAGALGIVVLMDDANVMPGENQKLFNLAVATPGTRFVFAHLGGMDFRFWNILALARTTEGYFADNIWFDISAMVQLVAGSPLEREFVWTIRNAGTDRVLLGADWPQLSLKSAADALAALPLTAEEKARIRWGNAAALLLGPKLPPPSPQSRRALERAE